MPFFCASSVPLERRADFTAKPHELKYHYRRFIDASEKARNTLLHAGTPLR